MPEESSVDALRQDVSASDEEDRPTKLTLRLLCGFVDELKLGDEERAFLLERRRTLEDAFYSEALYTLLRKWISPPQARALWNHIIEHRGLLTARLERNPGLLVAALDFLRNVHGEPWNLTLVDVNAFEFLLHDSTRDGLTLLHDRDSFMNALDREIDRARRYHRHMALNIIELDDFTEINANHGRVFGDFVLRELAGILERTLRSSDLSCRFRNEQVAMLLPESNVQRAFLTAERVRRQVEKNAFAMREGQTPVPVSISAGVAEYPIHGRDVEMLIESAESALALAREGGQNRVCLPPRVVLGA